jgi:Arc/MetJ-type ribon-helix-helix transcriptional regulator
MKTLKVQEEIHEKLTTLVGELTAESGKLQTYADVLTKLLETSIVLPEDLVKEINDMIVNRRAIGYTTIADFVRDAVRRRLEDLQTEEVYVNIPIPLEEYRLLNRAMEETGAVYRNADDYMRQHIREKTEEYQQYLETKKRKPKQ